MELTEKEFHRYARHLIMDEIGEEGQEKLLQSKVLVVGAGGLGAPVLMYLAAAGIGVLGVIDDDEVDITNLQRQIIHMTNRVGDQKVISASDTIAAINPGIRVITYNDRLKVENAFDLIKEYDLIIDGSDNFETRYLVNDLCYFLKKPLVSAALLRFEGHLYCFKRSDGFKTACYRCIFAEPPPEGLVPRCDEAGILGVIAGVMGSLQATEVLKEILGIGSTLAVRFLIYDALATSFHTIKVPHDPNCPLCGDNPSITITKCLQK